MQDTTEILIKSGTTSMLRSLLSSNRYLSEAFHSDRWTICKWEAIQEASEIRQWERIFEIVIQAVITKLCLEGSTPEVLRSPICIIAHIRFPNLQKLHLGHCEIESIEPLSKIQCPNLQQLSLVYNNIVRIRPLRKCHFKSLTSLWVSSNCLIKAENRIVDMECLCEVALSSRMSSLMIEFSGSAKMQGESLSWVIKLPPQHINMLHMHQNGRVGNSIVVRQLEQRYKNGRFR